ncbi:hypothetical protein KKG31_07370 [Patescibacteria group bacterium]|nr:hypothetical protein [Patescibacteria group bacterium]MBU1758897.1 hypothetical protein [Patescibacteria group bacterium]
MKKFILKHKAVSLAIITVLVIFVITSSLAHGRRGEKFRDIKDFPREMMGQEV